MEPLEQLEFAHFVPEAESESPSGDADGSLSSRYTEQLGQARSYLQDDRLWEAGACCSTAIQLAPAAAPAYRLLGHVLISLGKAHEAETTLREAVRLEPERAEGHCSLGVALSRQSRADEAESCYRAAIRLKPDYALAYGNLGGLLGNQGRLAEAEEHCRTAVNLRPHSAEAHNQLGVILSMRGRHAEAEQCYLSAICLKPDYAMALNNLGSALLQRDRSGEAAERFRQAIFLKPGYAEAYSNLATALLRLGQAEEAAVCCREALRLKPGFATAFNNLGSIHKELGLNRQAEASFRDAILHQSDSAEAHSNLGIVLFDRGELAAAEQSYRRALELQPLMGAARFNLGLLHLIQGQFTEGWPLYEGRWDTYPLRARKRAFRQPLWLGDADIRSKTILLHAEQGLGDTIQFCRYAKMVKALGATVLLQADPCLLPFLRTLDGVDALYASSDVVPEFDFHCPLISLPLAFKTELASIPGPRQYLRASTDRIAYFEDRLGPKHGLRVGLAWRGNPKHKGDRCRSMSLESLMQWLPDGCEYVSLQKDMTELEKCLIGGARHWRYFSDELLDFGETAALASCLDLIISVDTSVCHLAGALGRPTWILLPWMPDWRWLLKRKDSPWYPSVKLFRQTEIGDWEKPLSGLSKELGKLIKGPQGDSYRRGAQLNRVETASGAMT